MYREVSCILHLASPKVVTWHIYGAESVPGDSQWYNLQSCFGVYQFYVQPCVCGCVYACVWVHAQLYRITTTI